MLSKSKGQVLRVAAVLHVLFHDIPEGGTLPTSLSDIPPVISNSAIIAAMNFVDTCCQHAAFVSGRGQMEEEIQRLTSGL